MTMNQGVSKTVHTPVFYATPQPSASTSSTHSADMPASYLDSLSRKHIALAQIVEEIPGEGEEDVQSKKRVELLRNRVLGAFKLANGEPADGKWTAVAQLLRLRSTKGRSRWLGSSREGRKITSSTGWINAYTESEWNEWERKWNEEDKVMRKVESWKQKLQINFPPPSVISVSGGSEGTKAELSLSKGKASAADGVGSAVIPKKSPVKARKTLLNTPNRDSRSLPALGFTVMKRSSLALNGKPRHTPKSPVDDSAAGPSKFKPNPELADLNIHAREILEMNSTNPHDESEKQNIADISETSFLPPSFPSQLPTSTPNDKTDRRRKPPPIPPVPSSTSLPSSPNVRTYSPSKTHLDIASFPPELPATPKGDTEHNLELIRTKRQRSITPDQVVKKARTTTTPSSGGMAPPDSPQPAVTDDPASSPMIVTPKRPGRLPTLKELLASSRSAKQSPKKRKGISASPAVTLNKGKEKETSNNRRVSKEGEKANNVRLPFQDPLPLDDPLLSDLTSVLGYDVASPTKSLSSLAESDSDSAGSGVNANLIHDIDDDFDPPFASTQAQDKNTGLGLGFSKGSSGFGWMGYSSQFDVNGKVDQVSKFMEKDVDYDWPGDPLPEIEETQW